MPNQTQTLPEGLYTEIQTIFRATPVVLAGSGFSCGYGLPHMGALGGHLVKVIEARLTSGDAKAIWADALAAITTNLEDGLNTIPQGVPGRDEIVAAIRQETAKLILEETMRAEASVLAHPTPKTHAPVRLLKRLYEGSPQNADSISVITTNYDTLLELFCDLAELPLDTGFVGFRRRKPRANPIFQSQFIRVWATDKKGMQPEHRCCKTVRLHKPHGSISWLATPDGPVEVLNDTSDAARAIVVPGPSKYQDALVNTLFDTMRTEMNSVLAKADALLCVGFGFNDDHLQGVIKARLAQRMPMIIVTRDSTDNIEKLLKAYPHAIAFFSQGTGSLCRWNGASLSSTSPLWQLDNFLKAFVE